MSGALAVHPGALGDVLLAIPALRALRERHGRVMLAAQPRIGELLLALDVVDEACALDRLGLDTLFVDDTLRAPLPAAERLVCWMGVRDSGFRRRLFAQAPSVTVAPSVDDGGVWEHLLDTAVRDASAAVDPIIVPAALREAGRDLLRDAGWDGECRLVMAHPGAGGAAKRWPVDGFACALDALSTTRTLTVAVHRGPADAEPVAALVRQRPAWLVLAEPSLPVLAGALRHATAYVGNDSGVSHLATAVGVPAVVLFVEANLRWRPWSPTARELTVDATRVRPEHVTAVVEALAAIVDRASPAESPG